MTELELKYGTNPNQKPARIFNETGRLPVEALNGRPGYINFLDALNSYALVCELSAATGLPAAASFKHVSPAGVAVGLPLTALERLMFFAPEGELSDLASAYVRARGSDRVSSYGDWAALSDICDADTARVLLPEVSDGVIAPGYTEEALELLLGKRRGGYNIVKIDPDYIPEALERRQVYGITFEQSRNAIVLGASVLDNIVTHRKNLPADAARDLIIAMTSLKYTQSNSVALASGGGAVGIGAGQQSRIHCTRLASAKADNFRLRQHQKTLDLPFLPNISRPGRDNAIDLYISADPFDVEDLLSDGAWQTAFTSLPEPLTADERAQWLSLANNISLASDAFFPFSDNIERAVRSGVKYIAEPGGSIRDNDVIAACNKYGVTMAFTGVRLFTH